jgi:hypothetical protein
VTREEEKLKLGKGAAVGKGCGKRSGAKGVRQRHEGRRGHRQADGRVTTCQLF